MTAKLKGLKGMVSKSNVWTGLFRGTATVGIGAILYLQQNFVAKERFDDYRLTHQQWGDSIVKNIDEKLERLTRGQESIEQELRMMNRKARDAVMAIPQKER